MSWTVFSFIFLLGCEQQKILKTDQLSLIQDICGNADENTLIIFDMDNVLTESKERAFQADIYDQIKDIVQEYKQCTARLSKIEQEELKCAQWHVPVQLVDTRFPKLIENLQDKNIKTLLLSQNPYGKLGTIKSIEELCYFRLKNLGIDFSKSWNISPTVIYSNKHKSLGSFYRGEIFTLNSKDLALEQFLTRISPLKFKKIIFIDDKRRNLENIQDLTKRLNLIYIGIEYTKGFPKERDAPDIKKIRKQFDHLLKFKQFRSL